MEFYAANAGDPGDYLIGEEIDINGNGTPLRYMDKPSKDGARKDCWSSSLGGLDPHYSSGPLNHWFYLASEGSGAKTINGTSYNSPTCDGSTVTGIGRDKAAKVWYRTLSTYLTSSSNYAAAREGAIKSAKDLYGASSAECTGVAAAFTAIAVPAGAETCGGTTPPPTGGNLLANPGFESGTASWAGTAGPITNNTGRPAHTGSWKAWLGGNGTTATENISQSVAVPSTAAAPVLSFWLRTDTSESGSTAYDTMKVQVVSGTTTTTLATYSNVGANATYAQKSFSLSAYKGKTITVKYLDERGRVAADQLRGRRHLGDHRLTAGDITTIAPALRGRRCRRVREGVRQWSGQVGSGARSSCAGFGPEESTTRIAQRLLQRRPGPGSSSRAGPLAGRRSRPAGPCRRGTWPCRWEGVGGSTAPRPRPAGSP